MRKLAGALVIEQAGESVRISVDLTRIALKEKVVKGKKYTLSLQLSAAISQQSGIINAELAPAASAKPVIKLKAE